MSADEYNRMLFERMHSEQRWENQPAGGWSVNDLDVAEIRRTVAEAVRRGRLEEPVSGDASDMLRGLGLLRDGVLLRAAAVLFGSTERVEFEMPQCLLRVARFRGVDRMQFLDNRQFNGNAFTLLASAERFLRDTLPIAGRFEQARFERIDEPLYPPLATREGLDAPWAVLTTMTSRPPSTGTRSTVGNAGGSIRPSSALNSSIVRSLTCCPTTTPAGVTPNSA